MGQRWPVELRVNQTRDQLTVSFDDGSSGILSAEHLRVFTPSAERVGHGGAPLVIGGKRNVRLERAVPVGTYAVRFVFSDGHDTGIYPLDTFGRLCAEADDTFAGYEADLAALGLSRQAPGSAPQPRRKHGHGAS